MSYTLQIAWMSSSDRLDFEVSPQFWKLYIVAARIRMVAGVGGTVPCTDEHVGTGLPSLSVRGGSPNARQLCSSPCRWPSSWVSVFCRSDRHGGPGVMVVPLAEIANG